MLLRFPVQVCKRGGQAIADAHPPVSQPPEHAPRPTSELRRVSADLSTKLPTHSDPDSALQLGPARAVIVLVIYYARCLSPPEKALIKRIHCCRTDRKVT